MARRRYVLQVVVDIHDHEARPSTEQDPTGFFGGMPVMLVDETEADGYVQSITILDTKEL